MNKINKSKSTNENKMISHVGEFFKKRIRKDSAFKKGYTPIWSKQTYKILEIKGRSYVIDDDTDVLYRQYDLLLVVQMKIIKKMKKMKQKKKQKMKHQLKRRKNNHLL